MHENGSEKNKKFGYTDFEKHKFHKHKIQVLINN